MCSPEVLHFIRNNMSDPAESTQAVLNQTADSLMSSDSFLREVTVLLLNAEDTVDRTHGLNLKSSTTILRLQVMGNTAITGCFAHF